MEGNRRRKIIIAAVVILALAILALFLWLWWLMRQPAAPVVPVANEPPISQPTTSLPTTSSPTTATPPVTQPVGETEPVEPAPPPDARNNLRTIARSFAERMGSFSNNSDFENILDLKTFMTARMADWADRYVVQARASRSTSAEYSGTTTRTVSADVTVFDEEGGRAEVVVKTQRHEVAPNLDNVYYQDLEMVFLKQTDEAWLVDSAYWGEKTAEGT